MVVGKHKTGDNTVKQVFTVKNHSLIHKAKKCSVAKQQLSDLDELVTHLLDNPIKIQSTLVRAKTGDDTPASSASGQWPEDVSHFANVPKYWLWQIIGDLDTRFTPRLMKLIDSADKFAVRKISECAFQLDGRTKIPAAAAADPQVLSRVLKERHIDAGRPLAKFFDKANALDMAQGHIDWEFAGPFELVLHEDPPGSDKQMLTSYKLVGVKAVLLRK